MPSPEDAQSTTFINEHASLFSPERYVYENDAPYFPEPWEGETEEEEEEFDAMIDAAVDELFDTINRRKDGSVSEEAVSAR